MATFLSFLALLLVRATFASVIVPCPFNPNDCTCVDQVSERMFTGAACKSRNGEIPEFTGPSGTWTINGEFNLTNAYSIPDNAFQPFKQILQLNLIQNPAPNVSVQAWQPHAFAGPRISVLQISNLTGVIPPPEPLRDLAEGLRSIRYTNYVGPITLSANGFASFINLEEIRIQDSWIFIVDDAAFAGLEYTLKTVAFRNTNLVEVPSNALNRLSVLDILDLSDNHIGLFSSSDFQNLSTLTGLYLNGNNLQAAVDAEALTHLPENLRYLYLESGYPPLKKIPLPVLSSLPDKMYLSLARNQITALREGDFPDGSKVGDLNLAGNPISDIDFGAMRSMKNLYSLTMTDTNLGMFDLTVTYGMDGLWYLFLDQSQFLKMLQISGFDAVPKGLKSISASNSGLEYVDSTFDSLLTESTSFVLDISNTSLYCEQNIAWMARHALCEPTRLRITSSWCKNLDIPLANYLSKLVPNTCPETTTRGPETTTSSAWWTTTQSGTTTPSGQCETVITVNCNCNCN